MNPLRPRTVFAPANSALRYLNTALKASVQMDYEQVIQTINSFQNFNHAFYKVHDKRSMRENPTKLDIMYDYLARTGITKQKLDRLSIIHVTGTKGKGSTSAFCESILRAHGYKTGFYSSPHLITVRERFRTNGKIIDKDSFMSHFNHVYTHLKATQRYENDLPGYFAFLTLMAFHVFLKEKVDVVILEVGIGGLLDYTNVVRNVPTVGISSLGLDHTDVLGNTIEEIAAEKAGIMKKDCNAYTVEQPPKALGVLATVADEMQCPLHQVPDFEEYIWENGIKPQLQVNTPEYKSNASLAIQLAHSWIDHKLLNASERKKRKEQLDLIVLKFIIGHDNEQVKRDLDEAYVEEMQQPAPPTKREAKVTISLPRQTRDGLTSCHWPGRFQTVQSKYATFYLDGAHTVESVTACINWYRNCTSESSKRVLLFNTTGARDSEAMMKSLSTLQFETACFSPNLASHCIDPSNEQFSLVGRDTQFERSHHHYNIWRAIETRHESSARVFDNVSEVLAYLQKDHEATGQKADVLITGSLHLVGAALKLMILNQPIEIGCDSL